MTGALNELLAQLKHGLEHLYGSRLRGTFLFGSYARGDFDEESDLDVLIVLDEFASYGAEVHRISELAAALSLEYEVSISTVFLRERKWIAGDSPFLRNVREEAIAA